MWGELWAPGEPEGFLGPEKGEWGPLGRAEELLDSLQGMGDWAPLERAGGVLQDS